MLPESIIKEVQKLACMSPHKEICGLISQTTSSEFKIYPIRNVSKNLNDFVFDKVQYYQTINELAKRNETIKCIYHSHLNNDSSPSKADLECLNHIRKDYLIVTPFNFTYTEPK